jgi:hypothetical protein
MLLTLSIIVSCRYMSFSIFSTTMIKTNQKTQNMAVENHDPRHASDHPGASSAKLLYHKVGIHAHHWTEQPVFGQNSPAYTNRSFNGEFDEKSNRHNQPSNVNYWGADEWIPRYPGSTILKCNLSRWFVSSHQIQDSRTPLEKWWRKDNQVR